MEPFWIILAIGQAWTVVWAVKKTVFSVLMAIAWMLLAVVMLVGYAVGK